MRCKKATARDAIAMAEKRKGGQLTAEERRVALAVAKSGVSYVCSRARRR